MFKDTLNSAFDNLKERTTNPFLGTLVIVWIVKNWKLVYSLFYFDGSFKLKDRLQYISSYFSERSFIGNMIIVVLITLALMVITYFLLTVSRLLTDFYEKIVIPGVSKLTDKSSVVLKTEYNKVLEEMRRLEERLEQERQARFTAQNERDESDNKLAKLVAERNSSDLAMSTTLEKVPNPSFIRLANKVKQILTIDQFNDLLTSIVGGALLSEDDMLKILLRENIVIPGGRTGIDNSRNYKLTEHGKDFANYWNNSTENITNDDTVNSDSP